MFVGKNEQGNAMKEDQGKTIGLQRPDKPAVKAFTLLVGFWGPAKENIWRISKGWKTVFLFLCSIHPESTRFRPSHKPIVNMVGYQ